MSNTISASTDDAKSVGKVLPDINSKLTGMDIRVPSTDVSIVDLTVRTSRPCMGEEMDAALKAYYESDYLKGGLGYTDPPIVSQDFVHNSRSSIIDYTSCIHLYGTFHKAIR